MSGRGDGEARRHVEARGRASDDGQVYQSGADQYVTHIHIAEARCRTAQEACQRADAVVHVLTRAVGELAARCQELEERAGSARAEGRAEARAEFAERLRDAELRVMRAQRVMWAAEEKRAEAEETLARARQEPARRPRTAEREQEAASVRDPAVPARGWEGAEWLPGFVESARAELDAVREELRQLGEEADRGDGQWTAPVIVGGKWVQEPDPVRKPTVVMPRVVPPPVLEPEVTDGSRTDPEPPAP
ncbi:hypothetical protein [Streptomyces sp. NPDC059781]|uniref:hypothetical protein n=1 Tax=unclassified Streptomyces TaxID=2593676 RepID=UPI00365A822D